MTVIFREGGVAGFRWGVWLAGSLMVVALGQAGAQQDDSARYTADAPGEALCTLKIHVAGFRNENGKAGGTVFATPDGWPENKSKAIVHGGLPISGNQEMGT